MWIREDFYGLDLEIAAKLCVSCDEPMLISAEPKAQFL
jgi:hypothetical protein